MTEIFTAFNSFLLYLLLYKFYQLQKIETNMKIFVKEFGKFWTVFRLVLCLHSQNLSSAEYKRHKKQWMIYYHINDTPPFEGDVASLGNGKWAGELSLQVSDITQCPVEELFLHDNNRKTMMKEIAHIHFTALTILQLGGNRIESVEGLARVHMPHIKEVSLRNNNITSVGVMRKAAWPGLEVLIISGNYFGDANPEHGFFAQLKGFWVYSTYDKNGFIEQCFPAKMQSASLKYLRIRENKFCFGRCLKRVLKKRWAPVNIN